jgi:sphingolipid delta-4 desaturase
MPSRNPHVRRRRQLLAEHPQIARLFGPDRRIAYLGLGAMVAQLATAATLQRCAQAGAVIGAWWAVLLVAISVGAVLSHVSAMVMHEATHNLCARSTVVNRVVAIAVCLALPLPAAMPFRRFHLAHHRHFHDPAWDPDLPSAFELRWLSRTRLGRIGLLVSQPVFGLVARGHQRGPDRWEVAGFLVQLAANATVWLALGPTAFLYLLVCNYCVIGLHPIASHFYGEHDIWSATQATHSYYGWLNRLTLNVGYHYEHHDFPAVPGTRLPALHRIARAHYDGLEAHRSVASIYRAYLRVPPRDYAPPLVRALEQRAVASSV